MSNAWPVDERKQKSNDTTKKKGKGKATNKDAERTQAERIPYPELELGGNILSLTEKDNRLQWTSAAQLRQEYKPLNVYKSGSLFPPTRPPPTVEGPSSVRHKSEQGANFLRTFLPDIDISSDVIRDQLADDSTFKRELERFDPELGNLLDFIPMEVEEDSDLYGYLAFPMGELGRELNVSRIIERDDDGVLEFAPSVLPMKTYQTPLRHIVAQRTPINHLSFLAVRTFGQTHIERIQLGRTHSSPPSLVEVLAIPHFSTGNKGLVDLAFTPSNPSAFAVNEFGVMYQIDFAMGQNPFAIRSLSESVDPEGTDGFWRVSPLGHHLCLRLSNHCLHQVDVRSKDLVEIFGIPRTKDLFTSIEKNPEGGLLRACSTKELFWFDRRMPGRPILSYKHGREYDRTLNLWSTPWASAPTLLTSKRNQLMTVYDVFREEEGLTRLNSLPSLLSSGPSSIPPTLGQVLVPHKTHEGLHSSATFVSLSDTGALHHIDFGLSDQEDICIMEANWSAKVKALNKHPPKAKPLPYEEREFSEADFSKAYDRLFNQWLSEREQRENEDAEILYELIENFPRGIQQSDTPLEHMMTTYDAILRSGEDPIQPTRADFLTDNSINSTRGFRALEQGRLSIEQLAKDAAWHRSILPTLQHFDPDATHDVSARLQSLQKFNLAEDDDRSFSSINNEKIANEQLALDLVLSAHVFSMEGFAKPEKDDTGLETMTETLTLGAGPPPVKFGYFRPVQKAVDDTPIDDFGSPGVRAMLNNWKVGADPDKAIHVELQDQRPHSPVDVEPTVRPRERAIPATQPTRPPMVIASQPAKPPPIVAARSQELLVGSQRIISEDASGAGSQSQSQSQVFASTQILPGAHGGRPQLAKKKIAKKRVGGF